MKTGFLNQSHLTILVHWSIGVRGYFIFIACQHKPVSSSNTPDPVENDYKNRREHTYLNTHQSFICFDRKNNKKLNEGGSNAVYQSTQGGTVRYERE
jgi:hypothetical protein